MPFRSKWRTLRAAFMEFAGAASESADGLWANCWPKVAAAAIRAPSSVAASAEVGRLTPCLLAIYCESLNRRPEMFRFDYFRSRDPRELSLTNKTLNDPVFLRARYFETSLRHV